jgi:hypothetical protein
MASRRRACVGVLQSRAIVPNGSARRASVGVLRLFGCFALLTAVTSGSDRLGTIDLPCRRAAAVSYSVEPLSPMAPRRRAAEASYGCLAVLSYRLRWFQVPIDWGQSIYHADAQRRRLTV